MGDFTKIARAEDVPLGEIRSFESNGTRLIIAHAPEGFFAFEDACSHDGAPFGNSKLHSGEIQCCRHGARFDVCSGDVLGAPAVVPLETYPLKTDGDDLLVDLG